MNLIGLAAHEVASASDNGVSTRRVRDNGNEPFANVALARGYARAVPLLRSVQRRTVEPSAPLLCDADARKARHLLILPVKLPVVRVDVDRPDRQSGKVRIGLRSGHALCGCASRGRGRGRGRAAAASGSRSAAGAGRL